jgi:radical SAM protein with 4Fe4S-binding SPASM domain
MKTLPAARPVAGLLQTWGGMAKYRGRPRLASALYRAALALDGSLQRSRRELAKSRPRSKGQVRHIQSLILGTTGTCNASCIHCPTGKAATANVPRGTMPMPIFRKIIDGIVEEGVAIDSHIGFGLFGDGLVDPLVMERAQYVHARIPDALLSVNTNGAAYNAARHASLFPYVTLLALHCESLTPETYDRLMTPLRARNVFPKYEAILRDFPGKVRVSVPVSRLNLGEIGAMRDWFMERGAKEVVFDPMSSRCVEDRRLFDRLSLSPYPIRCDAEVTRDLIVDCDGVVLPCCNDFAREQPIGNLAFETFRETMLSLTRRQFAEKMARQKHDEIPLCSRCFGDVRTPDFPFDHPIRSADGE